MSDDSQDTDKRNLVALSEEAIRAELEARARLASAADGRFGIPDGTTISEVRPFIPKS